MHAPAGLSATPHPTSLLVRAGSAGPESELDAATFDAQPSPSRRGRRRKSEQHTEAAGAVLRFARYPCATWDQRTVPRVVSNTVCGTECPASARDGARVVRGRGRRIPPAATNCYTTEPRAFVQRHRTRNAVGSGSGARVRSPDTEGWTQDFQSRARFRVGLPEAASRIAEWRARARLLRGPAITEIELPDLRG
jgi:hypothetical protein